MPVGTLTGAQLELMELVWAAGDQGETAAGIWQAINQRRPVARTTVQTMLGRLEKRGWLIRQGAERGARYQAACDRAETGHRLAGAFVDEFFDGSATRLMKSLLGSKGVGKRELEQLRKLLDEAKESR